MSVEPGERRGFDVTDIRATDTRERELTVCVRDDAPQLEGHFPGRPVLPAVAQLADLILPEIHAAWPDLPPLSGAPRIKFTRVVSRGERLRLTLARVESKVRFQLVHDQAVCASGTLTF